MIKIGVIAKVGYCFIMADRKTLRYGFENTGGMGGPSARPVRPRLFLEVPQEHFAGLAEDNQFSRALGALTTNRQGYVAVSDALEPVRLSLNTRLIGRAGQDFNRPAARSVAWLINWVNEQTPEEMRDPKISPSMGIEHTKWAGRLPMQVELTWPDQDDGDILSDLITRYMQSIARDLKYPPGLVFASISRGRGVNLETNEMGTCSLVTEGSTYRPDHKCLTVSQTNLYAYEQQLICLAGAVALATADELISSGQDSIS